MRMIDHSSISWRPYPHLNTSSPEIRISRPRTTAECRLFQPLSLPACSHIASGILSCSQCEATCAVASISAGSEVFSVHSDYRNWVNRRESSKEPVWRRVPAGCRSGRLIHSLLRSIKVFALQARDSKDEATPTSVAFSVLVPKP